MVKWFAPSTLVRSGLEVLLSGIFAHFADKREAQAGLTPPLIPLQEAAHEVPTDGPLWVDFVSDVGDGFDSTYTIAWLLAQEELPVALGEHRHETKRGHLLVLGGDQVYPTASWQEYRERLVLPYTAALAFVAKNPPRMFAIPGNHDWYDGLTSFVRLFCQGDWIGGWHTRQRRSYFAVRLPANWWVWGIDIQFDAYIDEPQLDFFRDVADQMDEGDRVILVTSKPSWVHVQDPEAPPQSWKTLAYFEQTIIHDHGGEVALTITGDLHHYCHYEGSVSPKHRITAGGGGAYMSATHPMPCNLQLPPHRAERSGETHRYERGATYPPVDTSRKMRKGVLRLCLPWHTWTLGPLVGGIYALFAVLLAAGIKDEDPTVLTSVAEGAAWSLFGDAMTFWVALLAGLLAAGLIAFAKVEPATGIAGLSKRAAFGLVHTLLHLVPIVVASLLVLEWLEGRELGFADQGFWPGYLTALIILPFGLLWGRAALAFYLYLAHLENPRQHANDVFAAQSIKGYKEFIRLRLGTDGRLTVFPIGVREVIEDWQAKTLDEASGQNLKEPWFNPGPGGPPRIELIEKPFDV
jgi:hypothetical protein